LRDVECFDREFFGVHAKEAEVMDPQHRIFLEGCWEALERAGYAPGRVNFPVGIFCGATFNTYWTHALSQRKDLVDLVGAEQVMFGNEKDYIATRTAYKLNLRGPAINLDTACSSSLTAICQACQSLLTYQCDMALAGGVSVTVPQTRGYEFQEGNIGSPDGRTRTFDRNAQGTVFSNGLALLVLKRLEEAIDDRDQIFGVIRGFAVNNDGADRVSFTAPGVSGQAEVIALAQAVAGVSPEDISYLEAHGTATPVGDPIEVAALTEAFRRGENASPSNGVCKRKQYCGIGSVKSNIGHLDAASGAAGLIKTTLSLHHRQIPASLHFSSPNPKLDLENSPFFVNDALRPWTTEPGKDRCAGVSSFGTGGTNAHVIVSEAPEPASTTPSRPYQILMLSAKTPKALQRMRSNLAHHLRNELGIDLADVAYTLQTGRSEFIHRQTFVCNDLAHACALLDSPEAPRTGDGILEHKDPRVVFMFPGQGAQFVGMGVDLYHQEPSFRATVDQCANLLRPWLKEDLRQVLFPTSDQRTWASERILQTRFTQPAIFTIEYALANLWMSWGIQPSAMIGHSVGEFVAACLAGVLSLEDALKAVACRAELVQAMPPGSMLAVRASEEETRTYMTPELAIAAVNSPQLCVVAGPTPAIEELEKRLEPSTIVAKRLRTSHAFHSPMMDPVIQPFTGVLRGLKFSEPRLPYVSNVTADWIKPEDATNPEYWAEHVRKPVRFAEGLTKLLQDPSQVLLEVGPGSALSQLARQHPARSKSQSVVTSLPHSEEPQFPGTLVALGSLWRAGVHVDWQQFYAQEKRRRVVLPTYPFERTRCWPDSLPTLEPEKTNLSATSMPPSMPPSLVPLTSPSIPPTSIPLTAIPAKSSAPIPVPSIPVPSIPVTSIPSNSLTSGIPSPVSIPRKVRLVAEVKEQLAELSGSDLSSADPTTSLLEFGLDSLLLTQVATLLRKRYRARITFRQLMEKLSTIDAIAAYLDETLPPDPVPTVSLTTPPAATVPIAAAEQVASSLGSDGTLNRLGSSAFQTGEEPTYAALLEQNLAVTAQLLAKLRQYPSTTAPEPNAQTPRSSGIQVDARREAALQPAGSRTSHGPFRPLDRSRGSNLSPHQKTALDVLIARYTRRTATSKKLAQQNRRLLADPRSVAGFKAIWKEAVYPIHTVRSEGSRIWDIDGNEYIDFVMGFGASLFGHRPPFVVTAVKEQLDAGFETGPIHPMAGEVARLVQDLTGAERVAFCSTGSEAVLAAIRVSRTVTARDKIVVFEGAYHGIFDEVLARPLIRNGELRSVPTADGIPEGSVGEIIVLQYGNPESLELLQQYRNEIAAVLVEPVQARNLNLVPKEFLQRLRQITADSGTALIFDEVVTGFRVQPGGAQAYFGIRADLATYGKVVGGGLPIGVVTGKATFMNALDGGPWQFGDDSVPEVGVTFFAGTFVRHPLALAAAKSVLTHLKEKGPELQQHVAAKGQRLAQGFRELFDRYQAPYLLSHFSSLVYVSVPVDFTYGGLLFWHLRDRGIHIFENRLFVLTTAHSDEDLTRLLEAMDESLREMREGGFLPDTERYVSQHQEAVRHAQSTAIPNFVPQSEADKNHRANRCSTLEEIQGEGHLPPLYCMPAADGLTLVYHELADRLGSNQPVYGLTSPGAFGEPVPDSFEEMATRFVEDIREHQPHGPYLLLGYCSGGSIAIEVAHQLIAAGEQVAFVGGIETYDWSTCPVATFSFRTKLGYQLERLYYHTRDILSLSLAQQLAFLGSKLSRTKSRLRVWRGKLASLFSRKVVTQRNQVNWNDLWRRHDEISVLYVPRPYPGDLLIIRPRVDYRTYDAKKELEATGKLNIVRLSAFPACLMTPPHVDHVAELLRKYIADGLWKCQHSGPTFESEVDGSLKNQSEREPVLNS
jgi:acyl transferase domain-containing protein/glutamate-1-semialdehyde aminotransferase/thioesterase domain-containing protein/aryl carrier-like protein